MVDTLYDLAQAEAIDSLSCLNSQKAFGQDVISRINHAVSYEKGLEELQALIITDLTQLINGLDVYKRQRLSWAVCWAQHR